MSSNRSLLLGLAAAVLPALLIGCSSDRVPDERVTPVTGQLLVDGEPASGALVTFHPANELDNPRAQRSFAVVGDDGKFQLSTYQPADGVCPGEYAVTINWPGKLPEGAEPTATPPDRLQGQFRSPDSPFTTLTVGEEAVSLDPFLIDR